jgi:hypothetical protein
VLGDLVGCRTRRPGPGGAHRLRGVRGGGRGGRGRRPPCAAGVPSLGCCQLRSSVCCRWSPCAVR